jgi:serine protease Do
LFDRFFGGRRPPAHKQRSLGTGFIISKDGYIITKNHVVDGADKITVALKGSSKEMQAEIIGRDPQTDVALIKVKSDKNLPVIKLGSSKDLQVGQWVVAVGNPGWRISKRNWPVFHV